MVWVSILKRKPTKEGCYYWLGKSNYGGRTYYDLEHGFEFYVDVPVNKVSDEHLFWLDETDTNFEY